MDSKPTFPFDYIKPANSNLTFPFDYIKSDGQPGDSFCKIGSKITPQKELNYYDTLTENFSNGPNMVIQKLQARVQDLEKQQEMQKFDPSKYNVQPGPLVYNPEPPVQNIYLVANSAPKCPLPTECPPPPPPCEKCPAEKNCPPFPQPVECPPLPPPCEKCPECKQKPCPPLECPECPPQFKECKKAPCPPLDCKACKDFQEKAFKFEKEMAKATDSVTPPPVEKECPPVCPSLKETVDKKNKSQKLRLEHYLLILIIVLIVAALFM